MNEGERTDPVRVVRFDRDMSEGDRAYLTGIVEILWDDFFDSLSGGYVEDSDLIVNLPPLFRDRAAKDWRRWLVTFTTVVWKLGQASPPPPACMAEQLVAGLIADHADGLRDDWTVADDVVLSGRGRIDSFRHWLEGYLWDFDHELLYRGDVDGIDDLSTGMQYGFGRMDYEGMFALFNDANESVHGAPHPLAALRLSDFEFEADRRLRELVLNATEDVARAVVSGESSIEVATGVDAADGERVARDVGRLLELNLTFNAGEGRVLVTSPPDSQEVELIGWWLERQHAE